MTKKKIRAVVIDDEPAARDYICDLLKDDDTIKVAGEASNGEEAVKIILTEEPDLIFLDIQMPEMNGFEVLKHIDIKKIPYIIFVTAYDQYAVKAFEVNALDYLLKPFERSRFTAALIKAKKTILSPRNDWLEDKLNVLYKNLERENKYYNRILIKARGRLYFLMTKDISFIEAAGNYVILHAGETEHLLRQPLYVMEERLPPDRFIRIHRSTIINVEMIHEIKPLPQGDHSIILSDGRQLTLSRKYRDRLLKHLCA